MKRLAELYWPESADLDPLVVAERRLLSVFLVLAGFGLMAVATVYFQKNTQAYPLHAGGVFLAALASLLAPIWIARATNTKRVAAFILLTALAVNTILGSWIDGLISVKAILFLPITVAAVLIFGSFIGLMVGLYSALVLVGWHVFRDRIGGNLAIPMSVDDLSLMLLIGLSIALTMLLAASAIYRTQLLAILGGSAAARREAELASRAKSLLLANVSHELRTPMSGLTGLASHLLKTPLDEKQRSLVEQISQSGATLERLLGDLLDFAALKSGGIDIKPNPLNPGEMLKGLVQAFIVQAEAKSIDFRFRIDPSLDGTYVGDSLRISQIVSNLLANAVKFTHQGHVDLEAHLGSATPASGHSTLVVRVSDTGPGIPLDAQDRIFEAFEQASDETGKRQGGVGLGLSICRALLDRMGGRITLESEPGRGCTFTAHLPLLPHVETAVPEADSAPSDASGALTGKRVLVIDDSAAHRSIVRLLLEAFGASFIPATTGEEGIACLVRGDVDIALVDLNLPDTDGVAVIRHISDMPEREPTFRIPVIAISADGSSRREADVRSAGACDLLLKPLSAHQLYLSMKAALSVHRQDLSSADDPGAARG